MRTRLTPVLAILALVASACGPGGPFGPAAQTYDVSVDNKTPAFNFFATAYFPNDLKVHPGDTVRFTSIDRGEPHTVTFGTLVDAAVAAVAKLPPNAPPPAPPNEPKEFKPLPELIAGEPPNLFVPQAAAQPCFLATGTPPEKAACSKDQQTQSEFNGTQAYFNSGYLPDKAVFAVKVADATKPGTYAFICLLHRAIMTGKLTVVDKSQPATTLDEAKSLAASLLEKRVSAIQGPLNGQARNPPDKAFAGFGVEAFPDSLASVFAPKDISIPVGGKVTWTVLGPHTVSFNAPQDAVGALQKASDGSWGLNLKALSPAPPPTGPPPPAPAGPPPPLTPLNGGSWDGKGFKSSGLILSFPPALFSYTLTFTQAGTYKFVCNIHPEMEGTVKVGN